MMYHEVLPDDVSMPAWTIVRASDFRKQIQCLERYFDILPIGDAVGRVTGKVTSKRPFAVVTFDDGYQGNVSTVLPIMKEMGLPFTVYAATRAIVENGLYWYDRVISVLNVNREVRVTLDGDAGPECYTIPPYGDNGRWIYMQKLLSRMKLMRPEQREATTAEIAAGVSSSNSPLKMLTEEELQRLSTSSCVTIGCHTHGHELLDQISPQQVDDTLKLSIDHIKRITGTHPRHFAYPNGNFNQGVSDIVQISGFETAVTTSPGIWSGKVSLMEIPRISIGRFETVSSYKALISRWL